MTAPHDGVPVDASFANCQEALRKVTLRNVNGGLSLREDRELPGYVHLSGPSGDAIVNALVLVFNKARELEAKGQAAREAFKRLEVALHATFPEVAPTPAAVLRLTLAPLEAQAGPPGCRRVGGRS